MEIVIYLRVVFLFQPSSYSNLTKNKPSSLWDILDKPQRGMVRNQTAVLTKVHSCKEKTLYTVRNGKIVQLDKKDLKQLDNCEDKNEQQKCDHGKPFVAVNISSDGVNKLEIEQRLTLEEIKQIPRFKDYGMGEPSQVNCNLNITVLQSPLRLYNYSYKLS